MSTPDVLSGPIDRRGFLKMSALAGGGLMLGFYLRSGGRAFGADSIVNASVDLPSGDFAPNAFIRISPQGVVTLISKVPESGQGIKTSLPMVIAEELSVDWKDVVIQQADATPKYATPWYGAGGSSSTPNHYDLFRKTGATARTMLTTAAAQTWNVPESECFAEGSAIHHKASGRKLGYGELVGKAATLPVPDAKDVVLKDPSSFSLMGKRISGVDNPKLVTGQSLFGIDVKLPGMVYAVYEKCPVFGGKVVRANLDKIKTLPGVKDAFVIEGTSDVNGLMPGVAIIASSTWEAFSARRQLEVTWDEGKTADHSWAGYAKQAQQLSSQPGKMKLRSDGDINAALSGAAHVVEAAYTYPFISHTNLEPQNCTAQWKDGKFEIWAPTQNPGAGEGLIAKALNVPGDKVMIHVMRCGGGFGRRLGGDFIVEAAAIAQRVNAPVKLTWTREDDLRHDLFRPGGFHFLKGGVDQQGKLVAWKNHFVTFGNTGERPGNGASLGADEFPGRWVPNFQSEVTVLETAIPMGFWRAPGSCVLAWVMHSFIDELAHAAGRDPLEFRLELLGEDREVPPSGGRGAPYNATRMKGVLKLVAEKSGWGEKLEKGRGRGIAFHFSHLGYVAVVADVTVSKDGKLKVNKLTAACDVGPIMNLSGAENQVEGSMIDGLSAAWFQEITVEQGAVQQKNFHEYRLLTMKDAPQVEVHFAKSDFPPTGLGEPALPPTAPAITNAIFAATGKRVRALPLTKQDLSWT